MFKRSSFASGIFAIAIAVLFSSSSLAESGDFTPESFIPDRFVDTEWRLSGDVLVGGGNDEISEADNQRISFNTAWERRYRAIPRFLDLRWDLRGTYDHSSSSTDLSNPIPSDPPLGRLSSSFQSRSEDTYSIDAGAAVDAGAYLQGDWFLSAILDVGQNYRDYPDAKRTYQRTNIDVGLDSTYRDVSSSLTNSSADYHAFDISFALMPGWGRLYSADFALTAMYIVDELRNEGLIIAEPTKAQMLKLAEKIYYYRLKHAVDTRLLRIETFSEILGYLLKEGIIGAPGIRGQALIADVWDYFPTSRGRSGGGSREFGYRVRAGLGIDYGRMDSDRTTTDDIYHLVTVDYSGTGTVDTIHVHDAVRRDELDDESTSRESFLTCEAEYHKPLNLKSQLDLTVSARYALDSYRSDIHRSSDDSNPPNISLSERRTDSEDKYQFTTLAQYRYFLNSRTDMSLSSQLHYVHGKDIESYKHYRSFAPEYSQSQDTVDNDDWSWLLAAQANYRLAIPTTLTITVAYRHGDYYKRSSDRNRRIEDYRYSSSYSLYLRLSHYLM